MQKIFYKVVTNNLKSLIVCDEIAVQYKVGKFVSSKHNLPLAVFTDLPTAIDWGDAYRGRIFQCEIIGKMKNGWLPSTSCWDSVLKALDIANRRKQHQKFLHLVNYDLPKNTVVCKSVKLIKEIQR